MRLIKIEHFRCMESEFTSFFSVPDDMSDTTINELIEAIRLEMIADAMTVKLERPPFHPEFTKHPDMLVKDVLADHKKQVNEYEAWSEKNIRLRKSFQERAKERGIMPLYALDDVEHFVCDWGHQHGLSPNYL